MKSPIKIDPIKVNEVRPVFMKAAAKDPAKDLISAIVAERPDLKDFNFVSPRGGALAYTYLVGREVFKALKAEGHESLETEIAILKSLSDVPEVPVVTTEGQFAHFFGMTRMPGVPMSAILWNMTEKQKHDAYFSLGSIKLACEQAFRRQPCDIQPRYNSYAPAKTYFNSPHVYNEIKKMDENLALLLEDYFARCDTRGPVLFHCDLNSGNVIVDGLDRKVTGLIDWGLSKSAPTPEVEFAWMLDGCQADVGLCNAFYDGYAAGQGDMVNKTDPILWRGVEAINQLFGDHERESAADFDQNVKDFRAAMMLAVDKMPGRWPYPTICGERLRQVPSI
jgi:aminoglycoside phosphotransferase (APT) family kinase protein